MNRGNNRENSGMQCSAVVEEKAGQKAEDPPWAAEWRNLILCWNKAKGSEKVKAADVNALTYCHSRLAFSEAAEKMTQFRWLKNKSQASVVETELKIERDKPKMMETYLMKGMFIPYVSLRWGNQRMEKAPKHKTKRERERKREIQLQQKCSS